MAKLIYLPNNDSLEFYDYYLTETSCVFKFFQKSYDTVESFFGQGIITCVTIVDDVLKTSATKNLNMKLKTISSERGSIVQKKYKVIKEGYYTEDALIDIQTGEPIWDEFGNQIIERVYHPPVIETIEDVISGTFINAYLERPTISEQVETINSTLGINVDIASMTLSDYKSYRIAQSKVFLQEYLEHNPLVSTCHGGVVGTYSITSEKQFLMMSNYMTYDTRKKVSPETATLTWNESGEVCEAWTETEFLQLMLETESIVSPLVSYQQTIEKQIKDCQTKSDVDLVIIDYSSADVRNIEKEK